MEIFLYVIMEPQAQDLMFLMLEKANLNLVITLI